MTYYLAMKQIITYIFVVVLLFAIFYTFWRIEWKYLQPTPLPKGYVSQGVGQKIDVSPFLIHQIDNRPIFLHFFSIDCPCSKFNIQQFNQLVELYQNKVQFYAVLFAEDTTGLAASFQEKMHHRVPLILQKGTQLAVACGVYSTPQVALLDGTTKLYYRGNYNKSRYCTDKATEFAKMALQDLLAGKPAPDFGELATQAYGCELPENYYEKLSQKNK
jgi:hypothetical protein